MCIRFDSIDRPTLAFRVETHGPRSSGGAFVRIAITSTNVDRPVTFGRMLTVAYTCATDRPNGCVHGHNGHTRFLVKYSGEQEKGRERERESA